MSDNDLIRRGDALNACRASEHRYEAHDAIDALPAVQTFTAADLEAACRVGFEMGAKEAELWVVRRAMDLSSDGYEIERLHGHMVQQAATAIRALTPPADLVARLKGGRK